LIAVIGKKSEIFSHAVFAVPDAGPEICACCFELLYTNSSRTVTLYFQVWMSQLLRLFVLCSHSFSGSCFSYKWLLLRWFLSI